MSSTLVVPAGRLEAGRLAPGKSTAIRHRQSCCLVRASRDEDKQQEETIFVLSKKPNRGAALEHQDSRKQENELPKDEFDTSPGHRSGYVALIGKPNVGKSTLLNGIIGQKLSIVTPKPQTTRHRILGLCSGSDYQIILYDTPGVLTKKMHKLDELMMKSVRSATINSDILLLMADICQAPENVLGSLDESAVQLIKSKPTLLVLNKKDLIRPGEIKKKKEWYEANSGMDAVMPISARNGQGVQEVKDWLISHLPFGPAYYPKDIVSEHQERFFVAEILREKIFQQYRDEIPYSCQVNVISYKEREPPAKDYIEFEILVEKESQRMILLGKDGKAIKTLATAARLDIEDFVGRKCYLEIKIKVKGNWRKDEKLLQNFGYAGSLTPAAF